MDSFPSCLGCSNPRNFSSNLCILRLSCRILLTLGFAVGGLLLSTQCQMFAQCLQPCQVQRQLIDFCSHPEVQEGEVLFGTNALLGVQGLCGGRSSGHDR